MTAAVLERLKAAGIEASLAGRIKRLHSIYQKLRRQKIELDQVYDFVALRVIVGSVSECYAVLGILHSAWRPVPGRIKDFIAMPRPNGYQSLHTSVIGDEGQPFEVQIRTRDMHRVAEDGIAAHWKYKEGRSTPDEDDRAFSWLRQLLEWQQEVKDPHEFLNSLKLDLYPEEVYCFTPKGEVKTLPRGASPIDFAYAIHTEVGHQCVGARVNGKVVPLRYKLQNGDIVEILTSTSSARHGASTCSPGSCSPRAARSRRSLRSSAWVRRRTTCSRPWATAACRCARCSRSCSRPRSSAPSAATRSSASPS
jgi:GTP pyrophosphokinase